MDFVATLIILKSTKNKNNYFYFPKPLQILHGNCKTTHFVSRVCNDTVWGQILAGKLGFSEPWPSCDLVLLDPNIDSFDHLRQ